MKKKILFASFVFFIFILISLKAVTDRQVLMPGTEDQLKESKFNLELERLTPTPVKTRIAPTTLPTRKFGATPTTKAKSTPTPTLTPQPIRTPNPPRLNISYPSEMQSIEMDETQTFCVVDVPAGGDHTGLQRRHNINDGGWTTYVNHYTLCFDPQEGLNRIQFQYNNSYGDESSVYTRQFNFHRIQNITVTLSGQIYRDENCNGVRDGGEANIAVSATVNIWKPGYISLGSVQSGSNGNFSFSTNIREDESIILFPTVTSPSGYKSNPHYGEPSFTLNASNLSASLEYPQVPNEFVGECY